MGILDIPGISRAQGDKLYGAKPGQRAVIIDTDWWTDVDDALAMRMAVEFERLGVWDILGVSISTTLATGPRSLDTLFLFDGRANMPIFVPTTSHVPSGSPAYQANMMATTLPGGASSNLTYGATTALNVPTSVAGLTRLLQDAPGPVEIIEIGYLNNIYELLVAQPALVAAKVSKLWVMGGQWPSGAENNFTRSAQAKVAANYVCDNWPSPITFLGFEIGENIRTGGNLANLSGTDPVAKAMLDYGTPVGRQSWDPMMMLLAASGSAAAGGYTTVRGTASVNAGSGANSFTPSPSGKHEYVVRNVPDNYYVTAINDLVQPNPARKGFKRADGTSFIASWLPRSDIGTNFCPVLGAVTDVDNLLHMWIAADNADLADAATVDTVYDRVRKGSTTLTATGALRPTMATQAGLRCWNFAGAQALSNALMLAPPECTVYAKVLFTANPSSSLIVANEQDNNSLRSFHLKVASGINCQGVSINSATATVDTAFASGIALNVWHVLAFRRSITQIEALYDGTTSGPTTLTGGAGNTVPVPVTVGARRSDASAEPMTGYVRGVRIYGGWHTDSQVTSVLAEM